MAGVNKVILVGNLGRDPEVRAMQNGGKVANLSIATSESWRDKSTGERKEKTEWHRVVIFGNLAEIAEKYLKKGSKVYVEGKMQTRKWTDQSGVEKYTTEVVLNGYSAALNMLDSKGAGGPPAHDEEPEGAGSGWERPGGYTPPERPAGGRDPMDDDIPF